MAKPLSREEALAEIDRLRHGIDCIDAALVYMVAERFRCTGEIGAIKARAALPPVDEAREGRQKARLAKLAAEAGLSPDVVEGLFRYMTTEAVRRHREIAARTQQATPPAKPA
ncbi:chorismate mutase [Formicincola oecophyllae]|uniref:chorismate mutase n=2 Tax=Formicincola oecophyllae TaxID=2558361 RepID=A0A4Y6UAS4_9PROT|nr:chorismate mutase [Formicincola oecophyllae]